jgi:Ca2+-transporting ATPase
MTSLFKGSPCIRQQDDLEAGENRSTDVGRDANSSSGPFDIVSTKNAPIDSLRRWRVRSRVSLCLFLRFIR